MPKVGKSGRMWELSILLCRSVHLNLFSHMPHFLGEFECKVDDKGRVRVPAALLRQLNGIEKEGFVLNKGFEKCLVMYPRREWERITREINNLNMYVKKNRDFVRFFYRGATEIEVDSSERVLLPKPLLEYAEAGKDIILFAYFNKIEIWSREQFDSALDSEPNDFAGLAEEVMGKLDADE